MIRGCQKRIYYVKNPESNIFDEAYFILRKNMPGHANAGRTVTESDMKQEARRIVLQTVGNKPQAKKNNMDKIIAFAAGALASSIIIGIAAVIIILVQ